MTEARTEARAEARAEALAGARWAAAFARADTDLLDCLAVNLAVLLADRGVADVRTPFAARWRFDLADGDPARLDLPPSGLAADLRELADWDLAWLDPPPSGLAGLAGSGGDWAAACAAGQAVLVVADAFDLPWVPYAGHQHMEHSFLVTAVAGDGTLAIADGYQNATEWGPAEPLTTRLGPGDQAAALAGPGRWAVPAPLPGRERGTDEPGGLDGLDGRDVAGLVRGNARHILAARDAGHYGAFLDWATQRTAAGDLDAVSLATWLLARSRGLHARWLVQQAAAVAGPQAGQEFSDSVASAWSRAAGICYIGLRRARAGRAVPPSVTECLREACAAEPALAARLLDRAGAAS